MVKENYANIRETNHYMIIMMIRTLYFDRNVYEICIIASAITNKDQ